MLCDKASCQQYKWIIPAETHDLRVNSHVQPEGHLAATQESPNPFKMWWNCTMTIHALKAIKQNKPLPLPLQPEASWCHSRRWLLPTMHQGALVSFHSNNISGRWVWAGARTQMGFQCETLSPSSSTWCPIRPRAKLNWILFLLCSHYVKHLLRVCVWLGLSGCLVWGLFAFIRLLCLMSINEVSGHSEAAVVPFDFYC